MSTCSNDNLPPSKSPGWRGAPEHPREAERLAALHETGLVGGLPDQLHEAVVKLASHICGTPIAVVSLVDADRQWFSAVQGMPVRETPREIAFCAHVIVADAPLIVTDATQDERFSWNPLVTGETSIRFYAGVQLTGGDNLPLGSLCVIDKVPRQLDAGQLDSLRTLASLVSSQLELCRRNKQLMEMQIAEREIAERLAKIASRVPGVIYQFRRRPDGTSCFPYASDGIHQIYRVTPEQVRDDAAAAFEFVHPDDRAALAASMDESASTLHEWMLEFRVRFPDGTEQWLLGNAIPEREPDGGTLWHGFTKEITHRKLAEAAMVKLNSALQEARQQAETANRAKSAFLANMSHEIRTPLTAILGFTDLLVEEGGGLSPQATRLHSIETIRNAGTHLLTIINDILDLSKIEAERMSVERISTEPLAIIRDVVELMRPKAEGKGIELSAVLTTPTPDRILSDPTRFRQILMNLVGNAVKFTETGRTLISAGIVREPSGMRLVIDVTDTGAGMTPEETIRLFQPFGQADDTTTRRFGGTGLGLTICRRLAQLMGGDVELISAVPGQGSCFRLSLPAEAAPGSTTAVSLGESPHPANPTPTITRMNGRILLAEDGPDNQRLISFHLRKAGATVDIAKNGKVALEMVRAASTTDRPYDLLLTDIQMPEMDGHTLTRTLRHDGNHLSIIALTAHAMAEDRIRCITSGCDAYLTKPIDKAALLTTCAQWIGARARAAKAGGAAA